MECRFAFLFQVNFWLRAQLLISQTILGLFLSMYKHKKPISQKSIASDSREGKFYRSIGSDDSVFSSYQ